MLGESIVGSGCWAEVGWREDRSWSRMVGGVVDGIRWGGSWCWMEGGVVADVGWTKEC